MNTLLSRLNALFAFTLTVMASVTLLCFASTAYRQQQPLPEPLGIAITSVLVKNVEDFTGPRDKSDLGFVTFDLKAELQPLFNWNVKQLFLYVTAEYTTAANAVNQVVLWDRIMLRGENASLHYHSLRSKYFFFDDGNGLRGNPKVSLSLSWNVIPNAGVLPLLSGIGASSVRFPDSYETTKNY
ncbi:signal peptidase complex subunit 3 [Petromyzon marinus]|uniref:Signal peptidase complex subunit 3 n=1 Tax=Petromyzon marinus TaxID=7757 RepID=A0AAJ7UI20_PETMA|nr:signal peptidase complex subunit 3 [Petromyzon marinus]